jgi:type II secretory pathway component PulF
MSEGHEDRIRDLEIAMSAVQVTVPQLRSDLKDLKESIDKLTETVGKVAEFRNTWKGGLAAILFMGGIVWAAFQFLWDKVSK